MGAYVSFDEQDGVQPTQSDEQLAWQLHQELLLERQPRRAAARLARQVVCDLAGPDPSSSEEEGPESCPDSDGNELPNADPAQPPAKRPFKWVQYLPSCAFLP